MGYSSVVRPSLMGSSSVVRPSLMGSSSVVRPSIIYASPTIRLRRPSTRLRFNCCSSIAIGTGNVVNNSNIERAAAPWLMVPSTLGEKGYSFYSLTEKKIVNLEFECKDISVVGSSDGYLVLYDENVDDMFLYNPISARRIYLPLAIRAKRNIPHGMLGPPSAADTWKLIINEKGNRAMIIFSHGRVAFCNPSRSIWWTELGPTLSGYTDIVYSKRRKMFICTTGSDVEEWDLRPGRKPKNLVPNIKSVCNDDNERKDFWWSGFVDAMKDDNACTEEPYVVFAEHTNQLYVVSRHLMKRTLYLENRHKDGFPIRTDWDEDYETKTIGFDVYRVVGVGDGGDDVELRCMEGSLDNLVMFIGVNHCFALPADDYPELKPDSIYFTDHPRHFDWNWQKRTGVEFDTPHDTGIYSFNDRTFLPLDYPNHVSTGPLWMPLWFTPSSPH